MAGNVSIVHSKWQNVDTNKLFFIYILCVFIYYIYKLIPKATTKKSIQSDMLKNTIYK